MASPSARTFGAQCVHLGLIQIADLEREHDLARNHVGRAGKGLDAAHRAHLPARRAGDDAVHHVDEARGGKQASWRSLMAVVPA